MGQNHPRGNQSNQDVKHSKFNKVNYPIKLFDNQAQTMEVELPCDETSYKKWKQDLKIYQKLFTQKKHLLLPQEHKYSNSGMCSQSGTAQIIYPKLPYLLEDEIQSVKTKKNTFSEPEIWKLLYVLVQAKKEYIELAKTFSYELGNINPKHIFLNEKSEIKVANPLSWPNYIDGYKSAVLREPSYLSPEDVKLLDIGALNNDANHNSEDFAIGMTLLSVGLVENLQNLYNLGKPALNMKQLEEKLILWKTTLYYSEILRAVVLCLLQVDPTIRLTTNQVRDFLKPHIINIQNSRPLMINNVNPKMQKKVEKLVQQLPDLINYRFKKYSPEKQKQIKSTRSLPKNSHNVFLPNETQQSKIESSLKQVKKIPTEKNINMSKERIAKIQQHKTLVSMKGDATQHLNHPASIARVKSQTRFTYSNRPLEGVSPMKFLINNQNGVVTPQPLKVGSLKRQDQKTIVSPSVQNTAFAKQQPIISSQRINRIAPQNDAKYVIQAQQTFNIDSQDYMIESKKSPGKNLKADEIIDQIYPRQSHKINSQDQKTRQIAQRLVNQGLKHTDSQIHVQQSNRQSEQTQINQLQRLQGAGPNTQVKSPFQVKDNHVYHTYAQILVNSDFQSAWTEFCNLIQKPNTYFSELDNKITVSDGAIEIPPGHVKLQKNKEQGKIHLENVSQKCNGQILGGVSKNSINQVQIWFNSSYCHDGKPFPTSDYFIKGLKRLKEKLEKNSD